MIPPVIIIQKPSVDFDSFIKASYPVLGFSLLGKYQDREPSDTEKLRDCFNVLKKNAAYNFLGHFHYSLFTAGSEDDILGIIELCNTEFLYERVNRGMACAIITDSLKGWKYSIELGCASPVYEERGAFNNMHDAFVAAGCSFVWQDLKKKPLQDETFYLEHK